MAALKPRGRWPCANVAHRRMLRSSPPSSAGVRLRRSKPSISPTSRSATSLYDVVPIVCTAWHTLSEKARSVPSAAVREDGSRTRFLDFALAPVASEVCGVVAVLGSGIGMTCSRESCMSRATRAPMPLARDCLRGQCGLKPHFWKVFGDKCDCGDDAPKLFRMHVFSFAVVNEGRQGGWPGGPGGIAEACSFSTRCSPLLPY